MKYKIIDLLANASKELNQCYGSYNGKRIGISADKYNKKEIINKLVYIKGMIETA